MADLVEQLATAGGDAVRARPQAILDGGAGAVRGIVVEIELSNHGQVLDVESYLSWRDVVRNALATTTAPPSASEALVFYTAALPLVERLLAMARAWRDREPTDPDAIAAHSECFWLALRHDLRLDRAQWEGTVSRQRDGLDGAA